jgi:alpha-amylase
VTEAIYDITRYWLEEMGVDGFRMDAIRHLIEKGPLQENTSATHAWLQDYYLFYKSVNPQAFTVGEAWTSTRQIIDYIGDEVDIAFEFDLAQAFLVAAKNPVVAALNVQAKKVLESYPEGQYGYF